jgi:hypothetical protein
MVRKEVVHREEEKQSTSLAKVFLFLTASFMAIAYLQADRIEKLFGFNVYQMIHGEQEGRGISSEAPSLRNKKSSMPYKYKELGGEIVLGGVDITMEVYLDGKKYEYMGTPIQAVVDKTLTVTVKKSGYLPFSKQVTLSKENNSAVVNVPELQRSRLGLLTTSQNYPPGSKLVYEEGGEMIERELPFQDIEIPEGSYQARVVNPVLGTEKKVEFSILENKKHFLE